MDIFVARQPIFKTDKKIFGYELLFRDGLTNAFPNIDGDAASSKLLSNTFFGIGIENITRGKIAFINFTQELLLKNVPTLFAKEKIIVEILETVEPEENVINACRVIRDSGYEIALDDFVYHPDFEPLIKLASIIKIDFMISPIEEIKEMINGMKREPIRFLAEKIETYDEFQLALDMGFEYFQGYFFSKPEIISGKDISPSRINLLQIIGEVNKKDCKIEELEKLIKRDMSISYKLLRYINSAFFRRVREITSIRHAIVFLGDRETKKFVSLICTGELAFEKPSELIRISIIRARFCELIGKQDRPTIDSSELFLAGLFSLMDAIMDQDMKTLMKKLPLSEDLKTALIDGKGTLADYLKLVIAYETGNWEEFYQAIDKIGLNDEQVPEYYVESVKWADAYSVL